MRKIFRSAAVVLGGVLLAGTMSVAVMAQRNRGGGNRVADPGLVHAKYDGRWAFVRLRYPTGFGGGGLGNGGPPWSHDYPDGEMHFTQILRFVTNFDAREDTTQIMTLDDPELCKYPIAYMAEPGYWTVTDKEAEAFRKYLQKGGFVIFDDFHTQDWPYFEAAMKKVLPDAKIVDLDVSHPLFHSFFEVESFDQVPQAYNEGGRPIFRGIFEDNDPKKRLLAIINYQVDISEYWEISQTGFYPIAESNQAYQIGVNWILYGLTH
jgi:hypothetical protein